MNQVMFDLYANTEASTNFGTNDLRCGDSLELLKGYKDNTFHSIITDPPYGLGKVKDIAGLVYAWLTDADPTKYVQKGGFMGQAWDKSVPQPALWKEAFRVLRPGAYAAVFCGTRTQDLMGLSLRLAGFDIRDTVLWIYGSGYPKVHNISKAIDAKLGAVRGKKQYKARAETSGTMSGKAETRPWIEASRLKGFHEVDDDTPISDEALFWNGWKNLLKPGVEIIILAQKPIEAGLTIAENTLKWGCGGLNIGAVSLPRNTKKWSEPKGGIWNPSIDNGAVLEENTAGGYPANVIYSHTIFCTESGNAWDCHPSCPVRALDNQSSPQKSEEGASRYFTQLGFENFELDEWEATFQYIAKPAKAEKNRGLEGMPKKAKVFNGHSAEPTPEPKGVEQKFMTEPQENSHTTVKPVAVFRWLVRLLTMPGGKVLDPFMGSGTSAIPCIELGFEYSGIELDPEYFEICKGRVSCALRDKSRLLI